MTPDASPAIELAPTHTATNGSRSAPLERTAAGTYHFGPNRIPATIERTTLHVIGGGEVSAIILRCKALPPAHYALHCGPNAYELEIE
jgi:hypothetical protein